MTAPPTWFEMLREARMAELHGWCRTAAILWTMEKHGEWWKTMGFETKTEALAQPEFQLNPSTAAQYVEVWDKFRFVDIELLERSRPRFLYQACAAIKYGLRTPEQAAQDATALSWSSFLQQYKVVVPVVMKSE